MNRRLDKTDIEGRQKDLSVFFFFCWIDASSREFTADAIFALFSERCGFFTRLFCYALLFFFFFAEKESKSMCLSVKKRFRRQEPAVWVSERERESKENLILLNSRHDCWNFCFFPLQHHEASVFFFLSNIFWFYFCFFFFSSAIIFFVGRLFSLTYRVAALATVFFFYTAMYQQLEVVYRNAPQFAAHCGCWRHRTVHPVCIIQTRLNRQRTSSVSKRKKSIFYDSGRFLLTIVFFFFFFHSLLNSALAPRRHSLQQIMGQLFFVYWLVVNKLERKLDMKSRWY